jgi:hypothetical protein
MMALLMVLQSAAMMAEMMGLLMVLKSAAMMAEMMVDQSAAK